MSKWLRKIALTNRVWCLKIRLKKLLLSIQKLVERALKDTHLPAILETPSRDISNRLLAVSGVSQLIVYGGDVRQYQVLADPAKLVAFNVSLQQLTEAAKQANLNAAGGFLINSDRAISSAVVELRRQLK